MSGAPDNTEHGPGTVTRRRLLRAGGAAATGVAGLGALSSTAAAGKKGDGCDDPPASWPRVTTRGHFDVTWYGSVYLTDDHTETDYGTADGVPWNAGEIVLFVHGWNNSPEDALCTFETAAGAFAANDYPAPVVGYSWDADEDWYDATEIAERNGPKLARFLADFGGRVRIVAHSLGARVALRALETLHGWGLYDAVPSVSLLGGAADDDAVSMEGRYGDDIEAAAVRFDNFWKDDDEVLQWAYSTAEWDSAVGEEGIEGTPPSNYTDVDVTYVPDHGSYYVPGDGCIPEVVARF